MNSLLLIVQVIFGIIIITTGCNHISRPSDLYVAFGIAEILLGILLLYRPFKVLIKQF